MSESDAKANEGEAGAPIHDASLRVDPRTLSSEEQDFARLMGFGEDPQAPGQEAPPRKAAARPRAPARDAAPASETPLPPAEAAGTSDPPAPERVAEPAPEIAASEPEPAPPATEPDAPAPPTSDAAPDAPPPRPRDWEEIHPRASALGRQAALVERAERVLTLRPSAVPPSEPPVAAATASLEVAPLRAKLAESEARIAELEATASALAAQLRETEHPVALPADPPAKDEETEALRFELDQLVSERDRLGDALAAARSACAEAEARSERLEAALRTARDPSGPVPEGDRALRAEVIGLRRRLEESGDELRRLREALDARATDLAIALAHRDDRQDEIDQQRERIERLEQERDQQLERLDEALVRQRELLALVSRIQAENVELRSTQAALEETLEARDLEISAREEHLLVTRRGLAARDEQLIDAAERLEQARHRHELLEAELDRARHGQSELEEKLLRRDARIASLSKTLARIEEAIGRPIPERGSRAASAAPTSIDLASPPPARPREAMRTGSQPAATDRTNEFDHDAAAPIPAPAPPSAAAERPALQSAPNELPAVLVAWRDEKVGALSGEAPGALGFLARRLASAAADRSTGPLRILSLGGARPDAEIELAGALEAAGAPIGSILVLEADEATAARRRQAVESVGLAPAITIAGWTDPRTAAEAPFDALLLADALWHQSQPDALLDALAPALRPEGLVLFVDRIAGGALTLSDETREKLAELWQVLPDSWTTTEAFAMPPSEGDDAGVPAPEADLLAALGVRFEPRSTLAFGHLADLAVGPARAGQVSESGAAAENFLTSIDALDESREVAETLRPRHGVALLVRREAGSADPEGTAPETFGAPWPNGSR